MAEVSGRPLAHLAISKEELAAGLAAAGMPPALAGSLVGFDEATALGYHATVTPAVVQLTGRAPATLREFLPAHRALLAAGAGGRRLRRRAHWRRELPGAPSESGRGRLRAAPGRSRRPGGGPGRRGRAASSGDAVVGQAVELLGGEQHRKV